jgi:hypothetical protein
MLSNHEQAIYRTPNAKVAGWTPARATITTNLRNSVTRQDSCPGNHATNPRIQYRQNFLPMMQLRVRIVECVSYLENVLGGELHLAG